NFAFVESDLFVAACLLTGTKQLKTGDFAVAEKAWRSRHRDSRDGQFPTTRRPAIPICRLHNDITQSNTGADTLGASYFRWCYSFFKIYDCSSDRLAANLGVVGGGAAMKRI